MQADEIECQVLLGRSLLWSVMPACFATAETAANLLAAATTACRLLLSEQSNGMVGDGAVVQPYRLGLGHQREVGYKGVVNACRLRRAAIRLFVHL